MCYMDYLQVMRSLRNILMSTFLLWCINLSWAQPYNVLFIVVDDLRPELGCYGNSQIHSPHIDKLAAQSLLFERAYCQAPICNPSRMSFLTGLRPNETGINNNDTSVRQALPGITTLPQHFREHGYQAEAYGKVFHGGLGDTLSWDRFNDGPKNREVYQLEINTSINDVHDGSKRGRLYEAADVPDSLYSEGIILKRAVAALERFDPERPFFLAVGFLKPHLPFLAPQKYWDLYDRPRDRYETVKTPPEGMAPHALANASELRKYHGTPQSGPIPEYMGDSLFHGYYACVSYTDAQVGKLLAMLRELGYGENTIVVLLGDHGFKLGDFNDWAKNTHFELDTRVPLILHHPDFPAGRTSSTTELIDLYPTLVSGAGLPDPSHALSGSDLMPLFADPASPLKTAAFSQRPRGKWEGYSVRTDDFRLVKWIRKDDPTNTFIELYDYRDSAIERKNLAGIPAYRSTQKQLSKLLKNELGI